ncbi:Histone acetyltransferase gcn5 [Leucoagaricus sp. SymC.cos]|nr:Histone acetyltransferase gcn5 [Leucoagaricus sp. SymC.cos]
MMHFLTYADNYAVGYFEKQGFSKDITLDRSVWAGYIKDYEGGTIMQCTMLRKVDYLNKPAFLAKQKEAILTTIKQLSRSHIVYQGLPQFLPGQPENVVVDPRDVPGLRETGWSYDMMTNVIRQSPKNADRAWMETTLNDLIRHPRSWPFRTPVDPAEVADYYEVIKKPMDLQTMGDKLKDGKYKTTDAFANDIRLVIDNCKSYNPESTVYYKNADKLEEMFNEYMAKRPS